MIFFVLIGLVVLGGSDPTTVKGTLWGVWFFLNFPIIGLIGAALRQYCSDFQITNKRLITKTGILSRQTNEILLQKIETVSVNQGLIARMVDCGDVLLTGTGSAHKPIREIAEPILFRDYLTKAIAHEDVAQRAFADLGEGKKREAMTVIIISVLVWLGSTAFALFGSAPGRPQSQTPNTQSSSESEKSPATNPQSFNESESSSPSTPITDNRSEQAPTNSKISKNFTGTYQRETGSATLKLLKLDNNHYKFEAFTEENQTTGQADGELTLNGATGTCKSPDSSGTVTVTLDQKTSSVSLVAEPREAFCGMRCTLDGTYKISKPGVPSFHQGNWLAGEKIAKPDTFKDPDGSFSFQLPGGLFKLDGNGGVNKFGQGVYLHSVDDKASIEALSQVFNKAGLDASMQEEITEHPEWKITMKKKGKDWYALSGYDNDMIFYSKTVITKNYDQIQFRIYFKRADRAKYAEATEMIAATFK